jgi:hypothetical protein
VFDPIRASITAARSPGERVRAHARLENAACLARLSAMADMLAAAHAADGSAERDQWRLDNWAAVCAAIGAAHDVTSGVASRLLMDAVILRERLPHVAALFAEGLISYPLVHLICLRTTLVQDPAALRALDAELVQLLRGRGAMSVTDAERTIDTLVLKHDPHAVRRTQSTARGCSVEVYVEDSTGIAHLSGTVPGTDGTAFDQRLHALAGTTCERDPRTLDQRRAAALGALGFGWDRLPCLCEQPDCAAAQKPAGGGVVIHVIARSDTTDTPTAEGAPHSHLHRGRRPHPSPSQHPSPSRHPSPRLTPTPLVLPPPWATWPPNAAPCTAKPRRCSPNPGPATTGPTWWPQSTPTPAKPAPPHPG